MGKARRAKALAAMALAACAASAAASPATDAMGLDDGFVSQAMAQFGAMGFAVDARPVDMDDPRAKSMFPASPATAGSAMFSMVDDRGALPRCAVAVRPSRAGSSPEGYFASAVKSLGGDFKEAWRAMFRHELGHCALAAIAPASARDPAVSEPFADVFSMQWGFVSGPLAASVEGPYAAARQRLGAGAHMTYPAIARWSSSRSALDSPCAAAWAASPADARPASAACPRPGR